MFTTSTVQCWLSSPSEASGSELARRRVLAAKIGCCQSGASQAAGWSPREHWQILYSESESLAFESMESETPESVDTADDCARPIRRPIPFDNLSNSG